MHNVLTYLLTKMRLQNPFSERKTYRMALYVNGQESGLIQIFPITGDQWDRKLLEAGQVPDDMVEAIPDGEVALIITKMHQLADSWAKRENA